MQGQSFTGDLGDPAFAARDILNAPRCGPLQTVCDEMQRVIYILADPFLEGGDWLDASRIVEVSPFIAPAADKIGDEDGGHSAVSHAIARVTGSDPDMSVRWVPADVGQSVDGLHDLGGPFMLHRVLALQHRRRKARSYPVSQVPVGGHRVGVLPHLVIGAADDQEPSAVVFRGPDVVIRINGVPEKPCGALSATAHSHHVRPILGQLRLQQQPVVDRRVGRHEDVAAHHGPAFRLHPAGLAILHVHNAGTIGDEASTAVHCGG